MQHVHLPVWLHCGVLPADHAMLPVGQAVAHLPHLMQVPVSTLKGLSVTIRRLNAAPMTYVSRRGSGPVTTLFIPRFRCVIAAMASFACMVAFCNFACAAAGLSVSMNGRHTYVFGMMTEKTLSVFKPFCARVLSSRSMALPALSPQVQTA